MKKFLCLAMVLASLAFPASAQETIVMEGAKPAPASGAPPVVVNPRKAAWEAKQKAAREQALKDAAAAKKAAANPPPPAKEVAPVPEPKVEIRRFDSRTRDAITGKEIEKKPAKAKKRNSHDRFRDKYKNKNKERKNKSEPE